jgi:hypothetical protein
MLNGGRCSVYQDRAIIIVTTITENEKMGTLNWKHNRLWQCQPPKYGTACINQGRVQVLFDCSSWEVESDPLGRQVKQFLTDICM